MLHEQNVRNLSYLCKSYETVSDAIKMTKQRILSLQLPHSAKEDPILGGEDGNKGLESVKGIISRRIEKELNLFPVWSDWLKSVPGIGPAIGGPLLMLYYVRHITICPVCGTDIEKQDGTYFCAKCDKSIKGAGNLHHRLEERDFATISKWKKFLGMHTDETGVKPKRAKGVVANWSTKGRTLCYLIGDQFNRQTSKTPYGAFLLERKDKHLRNHPEWTPGHRLNAARHEAVCLFLSHFWQVARTIDGKPTRPCYAEQILKHDGIIPPYHWGE